MTAPGTPSVPAVGWWVKRNIVLFPEALLTLTGQLPIIIPGVGGQPIAATLTLTGAQPAFNLTLQPIPRTLVTTRYEPLLTPTTVLRPAAGALTLTGQALTVRMGTNLNPAGRVLTLIGGGGNADGGNASSAGGGTIDGGNAAGTGSGGIDGGGSA